MAKRWDANVVSARSLVVKHTFLDFNEGPAEPEPGSLFVKPPRRVNSDPALFTAGVEDPGSDVEPGWASSGGKATACRGQLLWSDEETAASDHSGVPAIQRVRSGCSSTSRELSQSESGSPATETGDPHSAVSRASCSGFSPIDNLQHLIEENARLVRENEKLRMSMTNHSADISGCQVAGTWTNPEMSDWGQGMPQNGIVWVPYNFSICPTWPAEGQMEMMDESMSQQLCRQPDGSMPAHVRRRRSARRSMDEDDQITDVKLEDRTTVMLRNLPNNYRQQTLLDMLDAEGFAGEYDFIYLPMDFRTNACLGYAFVNMISPSVVPRFWQKFDGYSKWAVPSGKIAFVSWCGPHQGYEAHVERYRNSPVMHESVPDEYKPMVFRCGVRIEFPAATKKSRAPRVRNCGRNHV